MTNDKPIEKLTDKQEAFCREYVLDWNGTKAAIRAGYSEKTAYSIASENLIKPEIKSRIDYWKTHLEELAELSALMVINEHKKLAFSSIAHLHDTWITRKDFEDLTDDQKSCIAEISTQVRSVFDSETKKPIEVEYVKIKLYDKQKSLDSISKMLGYDAPKKIALYDPEGSFSMTKEERDQRIKELSKKLHDK
jgi:phage terminase small subunit